MSERMAHNAEELASWTWNAVDAPVERLYGPAERIDIIVQGRALVKTDAYAKSRSMSGNRASAYLQASEMRVQRSWVVGA